MILYFYCYVIDKEDIPSINRLIANKVKIKMDCDKSCSSFVINVDEEYLYRISEIRSVSSEMVYYPDVGGLNN